ncbi:MAG: 3,4-dihydroxy-2-butanone-4-phosphate synthase [Planctomycetaceae bacterium]
MPGFSRIEDALEAISQGSCVVVLDSEDRENEGDFVAAADNVTPELIHFMISHGRGQLCMPVLPKTAWRLDLHPMVSNAAPSAPRFAVPVDFRECHTGISPEERALTIRKIVDVSTRPEDYLRPGHIFPLIAQERGVLQREGHTEAAVDLARMAGLTGAGVLCEICSRDGRTMARGEELMQLAAEFGLPIIAIDALIDYRRAQEPVDESRLVPCSEIG